MRPSSLQKHSLLKPVFAGLLAALFLGMMLIGASEGLHARLHAADAEHHHSPCAVCAIAKSQVDAPTIGVSEIFASLSVVWTVSFPVLPVPEMVDLRAAPNRGPPASVSSQS